MYLVSYQNNYLWDIDKALCYISFLHIAPAE